MKLKLILATLHCLDELPTVGLGLTEERAQENAIAKMTAEKSRSIILRRLARDAELTAAGLPRETDTYVTFQEQEIVFFPHDRAESPAAAVENTDGFDGGEFFPGWSVADATLAESEGWELSEYSDGQVCVNAIEEPEPGQFADHASPHEAAHDHVFVCAAAGSALHKRALAICDATVEALDFTTERPVLDGDDEGAEQIGWATNGKQAREIADAAMTDGVAYLSRGGATMSDGQRIPDAFIAITVPADRDQRVEALRARATAIRAEVAS